MSPIAILLVLTASSLHVLRDFHTKKAPDKQIFTWWFSFMSLIVSFPVVIYLVWAYGIDVISALSALAMGMVHFLYWNSYSKAYEHGDFSKVYPIVRSAPAIVLIFAILFLHEKVTWVGILGIITITLGVYCLNLKSVTLKSLLSPITSIPKERHTRYAFFSLFLVGTYTILDKIIAAKMHPVVYGFTICFSASSIYFVYLLQKKSLGSFATSWKREKKNIIMNGIFAAIVYPLILYSYNYAPVSYVTALRQISVILAVLMGSHALNEKQKHLRLICSIVIVAGAIMVSAG